MCVCVCVCVCSFDFICMFSVFYWLNDARKFFFLKIRHECGKYYWCFKHLKFPIRRTFICILICNILVTWVTVRQLWMLLPRSWMWRTTLDWEMLSLPDTLHVILSEFACTARITTADVIFTLCGKPLKLVDQYTYTGRSVRILW